MFLICVSGQTGHILRASTDKVSLTSKFCYVLKIIALAQPTLYVNSIYLNLIWKSFSQGQEKIVYWKISEII